MKRIKEILTPESIGSALSAAHENPELFAQVVVIVAKQVAAAGNFAPAIGSPEHVSFISGLTFGASIALVELELEQDAIKASLDN
jgi:hypothetical protein